MCTTNDRKQDNFSRINLCIMSQFPFERCISMTSEKIDFAISKDHSKMTMNSVVAFLQATGSNQNPTDCVVYQSITFKILDYFGCTLSQKDKAISEQTIMIKFTATSLLLDETNDRKQDNFG